MHPPPPPPPPKSSYYVRRKKGSEALLFESPKVAKIQIFFAKTSHIRGKIFRKVLARVIERHTNI